MAKMFEIQCDIPYWSTSFTFDLALVNVNKIYVGNVSPLPYNLNSVLDYKRPSFEDTVFDFAYINNY